MLKNPLEDRTLTLLNFVMLLLLAGVGLAGAVLICLSNPIWWHHPWGWELMTALYAVLVFTVGGLVLARFFTPRPAA